MKHLDKTKKKRIRSIRQQKRTQKVKHFFKALLSLRALIVLFSTLVLIAIFCAAIIPAKYDITVGMVPTVTIAANRDVVDEITT